MKIWLFVICWILLLGCSGFGQNEKDGSGVNITVNNVLINYYENDSLNKYRPYVIPRIYYNFKYENHLSDSVYLELNSHFTEKVEIPRLFVVFEYNQLVDTLILTDYESFRSIAIPPNKSSDFMVGVPVTKILEEDHYRTETALSLMRFIAQNGVVKYNSLSDQGNKKSLKSRTIKKSKDFRIIYRDPTDTTVE